MSLLQALLLGIVQGLTEFLPVSSDGHLTLVPYFLGWDPPTLAFDVAVHIGTLAALVYVFREDVARLARTVLSWKTAEQAERRLVVLLAIGSVPAAIAGVAFKGVVEGAVQRPMVAAAMLAVTASWLFGSETRAAHREEERTVEQVTPRDSLLIGVAQATALLPGISRSGMTIGAGLRLGLEREAAARFSFLLGIPIIFGAIVFQVPDMFEQGLAGSAPAFLIGIVASGVTGLYAIRFLLRLIGSRSLRPFGLYCWLVAGIGLIVGLARG